MLSRKQLWMRQKKKIHRYGQDELYKLSLEFAEPVRRSLSLSTLVSFTNEHPLTRSQKHSQSDDSTRGKRRSQSHDVCSSSTYESRSVKFGNSVNVVLIPSREDYVEADLEHGLWWRKSELISFKEDAAEELRSVMKYSKLDVLRARQMLYQPVSLWVQEWKKSYCKPSSNFLSSQGIHDVMSQ